MRYDMELRTVVLNKDNMEQKLFELLEDLDQDLVGMNGEEYIIHKEYGSDLEYFISIADVGKGLENTIERVMYEVEHYWVNYYDMTGLNIIEHGDDLIVSVAVAKC